MRTTILAVVALALCLVGMQAPAFAVSATPLCTNTIAVTSSASVDIESAQTLAAAGRHYVLLCNSGPYLIWYCMGQSGTTTPCTAVSGQGFAVEPNTCQPPLTAYVAPTYPGQTAPQGDIEAIQDSTAPTNSTSNAMVCDF